AILPHLGSLKADRGEVMVGTPGRAPGPGDAQRGFAVLEFLRQRPSQGESTGFGVDQRQVTKVNTGTGDESAYDLRRVVAELFEQRFFRERAEFLVRHVRNDKVLLGGQPDLTTAVGFGQSRDFRQLV